MFRKSQRMRSYLLNYKALWLYYKTKAFSIVKLFCIVGSWSVDYCSRWVVLNCLKTDYLEIRSMKGPGQLWVCPLARKPYYIYSYNIFYLNCY